MTHPIANRRSPVSGARRTRTAEDAHAPTDLQSAPFAARDSAPHIRDLTLIARHVIAYPGIPQAPARDVVQRVGDSGARLVTTMFRVKAQRRVGADL